MYYFNFLVSLNFNDFYFFLNTIVILFVLWITFFKLNTNLLKINNKNISNINLIKISSNSTFLNFYFYLILYKILDIYILYGKNSIIWFNHFNLNNFTVFINNIIFFFSFFLFFLLKNIFKKNNLIKSIDYLFSLKNLILILPYIFCVNTIFTFLFLLETISVILLYKLISSKIWFKDKNNNIKNIYNNIPQNYINMIFFQYWVTFFSTIFIIYFYINVFYLYGTTEWFLIQYINYIDDEILYSTPFLKKLIILTFIFSIFFKLGLTPFHLFKVEVYKGLPYLSVFFYTTYYFVVLFIYFIFLLSDCLFFYINYYYFLIIVLLFIGSIYIIFLLFDVNFLKAFFTYSTVINTVGFLILFISSF